jgi:hypothetical protein
VAGAPRGALREHDPPQRARPAKKTTQSAATHRTEKCSARLCISADIYRAAVPGAFNLTAAHVPLRSPRLIRSDNSTRRQLPP